MVDSIVEIDVEKPAAGGRMLARHNGQVVLVCDKEAPLSPTDLRRLWSLRHSREATAASDATPGVFAPAMLEMLGTWGQTLRNMARGQYWIHPAMAELVENALLNLPLDDPQT